MYKELKTEQILDLLIFMEKQDVNPKGISQNKIDMLEEVKSRLKNGKPSGVVDVGTILTDIIKVD